MPIMDGIPYDTNKRYRKAEGDTTDAATAAITAAAAAQAATTATTAARAKRKVKVVKYLVWGLAIVGIYLLWKKYAKK